MPEGDTVWRTARHLDRALSGSVLVESDFRVPALATTDLSGHPVVETLSRGKHLLTRIGDDLTLHTHLLMEGAWHLYRPGSRWRRPSHEARVVLRTEDWSAVGFALGIVDLIPRSAEHQAFAHLGPDLLGPDWDDEEAVRRLRGDPARPIAEALLDQTNLAGIGNLYKSELCFLMGVHPLTPAGEVDLFRTVRRARLLLEANKERVEQTTTGNVRCGEQTWVYRRERKPCRRCGTPILVEAQVQVVAQGQVEAQGDAGRQRASYWCPTCQR